MFTSISLVHHPVLSWYSTFIHEILLVSLFDCFSLLWMMIASKTSYVNHSMHFWSPTSRDYSLLSMTSVSTEPLGRCVPIALFVNGLCRAHAVLIILPTVVTLQAIGFWNTRNWLTRIPNPFLDILLALESVVVYFFYHRPGLLLDMVS